MRRRRGRAPVVLASLILACGPVDVGEFDESAELSCASAVDDVADPGSGYTVIAENVALDAVYAPSGERLQLAPSDQAGAGAENFAKSGLLVRAGQSATLTVATRDEGNTIAWGGSPRAWSLTVPACPGDAWLVYTGGYYVDAPRPVWLQVESAGETEEICVGVGADCAVES